MVLSKNNHCPARFPILQVRGAVDVQVQLLGSVKVLHPHSPNERQSELGESVELELPEVRDQANPPRLTQVLCQPDVLQEPTGGQARGRWQSCSSTFISWRNVTCRLAGVPNIPTLAVVHGSVRSLCCISAPRPPRGSTAVGEGCNGAAVTEASNCRSAHFSLQIVSKCRNRLNQIGYRIGLMK